MQYWLGEVDMALPSRRHRWALSRYAARWRYREQFARGHYDQEDGSNLGRADYWNNLTRGQASTRSRSLIRFSAMQPTTTPTPPVAAQPGPTDAQQLVNRVLRSAATDCEDTIDALPVLLANGSISPAEAQTADRYLTALAEAFREPLRAQGLPLPAPIR